MMQVRPISITQPLVQGCETPGQFIAYCARISNPGNQANHETAPRLLRYLAKHKHWSPFQMVTIGLEVQTTRDIARQLLRHRFDFQEFSQRYAEAEFEPVLREARMQDVTNRQSSRECEDWGTQLTWDDMQRRASEAALEAYKWALDEGIAKEVARAVLPEGMTPSTLYVSGNVRQWMHYIAVRTDPTTQKEHRLLAVECERVIREIIPEIGECLDMVKDSA